jgi:ABC-type lipoprotein export system ATPase subunit
MAINIDDFVQQLVEYIELMKSFTESNELTSNEITILPGFYKDGSKERYEEINIKSGEIICIVGPTGSGKSRLLADIEWAANKDTPTNRTVLINGRSLETAERFSASNKLVAQLSQNMNFVMDLTVEEFLDLHATSRLVENKEEMILKIFNKANQLAGEQFKLDTPITSLSGGQSRALMISDTAILSKSPIVLIDEIENAGIDRKKALELLVSEDKIVLMSTHDPILALMGDKRIVINNGGIDRIIDTTDEEREILHKLERLDSIMFDMRNKLRYGQKLEFKEEF